MAPAPLKGRGATFHELPPSVDSETTPLLSTAPTPWVTPWAVPLTEQMTPLFLPTLPMLQLPALVR